MRTRTILLSGVCAAAMCTSALAADLAPARPVYKAASAMVPQFSWSGCYVGANLGWGHESRTWNGVATTPSSGLAVSQHTSGDGFVGGGQLGCDYQAGSWVFGIAGLVDGSTINRSTGVTLVPGATFNDKASSFETVTGRVGWAMDRTLFYALGGVAFEQAKGTINGSGIPAPVGPLATETHSFGNTGWAVGAGVEYAFADHWSGKIEYNYMGFADKTVSFPITTTGPVQFTRQSLQTLLVGVNYRFGNY